MKHTNESTLTLAKSQWLPLMATPSHVTMPSVKFMNNVLIKLMN